MKDKENIEVKVPKENEVVEVNKVIEIKKLGEEILLKRIERRRQYIFNI